MNFYFGYIFALNALDFKIILYKNNKKIVFAISICRRRREPRVDHFLLEIDLQLIGTFELLALGRLGLATIVKQPHDVRAKQINVRVVAGLEAFRNHFEIFKNRNFKQNLILIFNICKFMVNFKIIV